MCGTTKTLDSSVIHRKWGEKGIPSSRSVELTHSWGCGGLSIRAGWLRGVSPSLRGKALAGLGFLGGSEVPSQGSVLSKGGTRRGDPGTDPRADPVGKSPKTAGKTKAKNPPALLGFGGSEVPFPADPSDAGLELRDSLRSHKQSQIPKGSGMSPEVLLSQISSSSSSRGSSIPGCDHRDIPWMGTAPRIPTKLAFLISLHAPSPNRSILHPALSQSSIPGFSRVFPSFPGSQAHLGRVHGRFRRVHYEVAEGEAKPPLGALPQRHRLGPHPGEGPPLRGRVGVRRRPISPARCRLRGQGQGITSGEPQSAYPEPLCPKSCPIPKPPPPIPAPHQRIPAPPDSSCGGRKTKGKEIKINELCLRGLDGTQERRWRDGMCDLGTKGPL